MRRALDRVPEHVTNTGRVWSERRRDAHRHALRDEAHAFKDASPREVQLHVVVEDDVNHREAERRLRPDHPYTGEPLEVRGERVRHLVLHLLRAMTGPVREDNDLVVGQIGNRVDRRGRQRPPSPACKAEVQNDDDEPVFQCNVNESIDHEPRHPSCRARTRETTRPDRESEQTHDDCEWLNEEDREEDVLRYGPDGYRCRRAPSVTQNERRDVDGQNNPDAEHRRSDGGPKRRVGLVGILALR